MPLEEEPFAEEVKLNGYKVEARAGMLWAYLGPEPAPLVPDWEPFGWQDGLVQVVLTALSCNWLQCQENAIDPVESEWLLHSITGAAQGVPMPSPPRHFAFEFDEFDYGFLYRRANQQDAAEAAPWSIGRLALWPNGLFVGDERSCRFEWRVPMDDTSTVNVAWFFDRVAPGAPLPKQRILHWFAPARDEDGEAITSHALNRKFAVWLNQPVIVDRSKEVLGTSDEGVVMLRDKYFTQIALLGDGGEPKAVLRDPNDNVALQLPFAAQETPPVPVIVKKTWPENDDTPPDQMPKPIVTITTLDADAFPYLAGQPEDVEAAYRQVRAGWKAHEQGRAEESQAP
jgi:5,5'-dehydrodivanillate O-demethylase